VKKRDGEFIKWIEMKLPGSAMALLIVLPICCGDHLQRKSVDFFCKAQAHLYPSNRMLY